MVGVLDPVRYFNSLGFTKRMGVGSNCNVADDYYGGYQEQDQRGQDSFVVVDFDCNASYCGTEWEKGDSVVGFYCDYTVMLIVVLTAVLNGGSTILVEGICCEWEQF